MCEIVNIKSLKKSRILFKSFEVKLLEITFNQNELYPIFVKRVYPQKLNKENKSGSILFVHTEFLKHLSLYTTNTNEM